MPKKTDVKKYQMLDPIDHVLHRTDMYVGSKRSKVLKEYSLSSISSVEQKDVEYPPALLRIFVEILSNAVDNAQRSAGGSSPCKVIKVTVNKETGETSVYNDGEVIPIIKSEDHGMYIHTMVFGHLRSGENYNDTEAREVSGRNGMGASVTNVFSSTFTVRGVDPTHHKKLEQTWSGNMRKTNGPVVKTCKLKAGYTEVTYIPDFSLFEINGYTEDILTIFGKYVVDVALTTGVKVYWNNQLLKVPSLAVYAKMYFPSDQKKESLSIKTANAEVYLTPSQRPGFEAISFVNGVCTKSGGCHVDAYCEALFRPVVKKVNDKNTSKITIADVKSHFCLFVKCTVSNPEFDSQEKHCLLHPKVDAKVEKKDIDKLLKWSVVKDIENSLKLKDSLSLSKIEKRTTSFVRIDKLDDAQNAGTKKGYECSLVLTEGDSAATFALIGIETGLYGKKGRSHIGVMSLFGKPLNVRNSTGETITKNKVVSNLIQAIGLKQGVDYTVDENWKKLRYGRVVTLCDSDCDGVAIVGLLLNFFHYLYPSLLQRKPSFLVNMNTPIVRVSLSKGKSTLFYEESKFREFAKSKSPEWLRAHSQYYKGLGSSDKKDIKDLFGKKIMEFHVDTQTSECMIKVYDKKFSDSRKKWLEEYDPKSEKPYCIDDERTGFLPLSVTDFLENETITFSWENCKRSLPHLMDGLKCSQRKALFGTIKAGLSHEKPPMKVAQLGAYVAKETCYHHGEQSLFETIVKMAQDFVYSNNIPLLDRKGNLGSRRLLGADAAQPRYIFTRLDKLTRLIFRKDDEALLEYINEDGDDVEPSFYVPIIPMILVNGALGLGTGYSCSVPLFDPLVVIKSVEEWIDDDGSVFGDITPWCRGFAGTVVKEKEKFVCYGVVRRVGPSTVQVSEIPVDMSIDSFKVFLEDLQEKKVIQGFKNDSTTESPMFTITEVKDGLKLDVDNLKLKSYLHVTNMVLFGVDGRLKKYTVQDIIKSFCTVRLEYYKKRKIWLLNSLKKELLRLRNKLEFVRGVVSDVIDIRADEEKVIKYLQSQNFDTEEGSYNYLLNMPVRSLTLNMVQKLEKEVHEKKVQIEHVSGVREKDTWKNELSELKEAYSKLYR